MIRVSVVVPIYNVGKFLKRSIESIKKQTLKDIQIILVNDGSTDNSLSICKDYQEKDDRIEVIDKPNGGVSSARNAGIKVAKGEYIGFVDSDDWIEPEMYKNMYDQIIMENSDICICNYVEEINGKSVPNLLNLKQEVLEGQEILDEIITNMISNSTLNSSAPQPIMGSACRLIIKKNLFDQYNLMFQSDITLMEDLIFCIQALLKSRRVCINRGIYYHYILHSNSGASSYREDMFDRQLKVYRVLENLLKDEDIYPIVEQRMNFRYVNMFISSIANEARPENNKSFTEKIKFIKQLCKDNKLKRTLKEINTKGYTLRKKLVLKALEYEWEIYLYLYQSFLNKVGDR